MLNRRMWDGEIINLRRIEEDGDPVIPTPPLGQGPYDKHELERLKQQQMMTWGEGLSGQ